MEEQLRVRTDVLRACADELTGVGYRLGHGLAGDPALVVAEPGAEAATALVGLESATHAWLCSLGGRLAVTADGLRAAAREYDAADERATVRLAATGAGR
ncbi:type VII secretion target [Micromonospora sp. NPDC049559]|uniref:type VII secretion target n=1 Tax=Micromonospora sp. NPDC049559 TaxID=3155923 RepID=UPI003431E13B